MTARMVCGQLQRNGGSPGRPEVTPQAIYPIDAAQPYAAQEEEEEADP